MFLSSTYFNHTVKYSNVACKTMLDYIHGTCIFCDGSVIEEDINVVMGILFLRHIAFTN